MVRSMGWLLRKYIKINEGTSISTIFLMVLHVALLKSLSQGGGNKPGSTCGHGTFKNNDLKKFEGYSMLERGIQVLSTLQFNTCTILLPWPYHPTIFPVPSMCVGSWKINLGALFS